MEVSCVVDKNGIRPLKIGPMPEPQAQLVQNVKRYERLAVRAISERSRDLAVEALMAHPLVLSYSRAVPLVERVSRRARSLCGRLDRDGRRAGSGYDVMVVGEYYFDMIFRGLPESPR